MQLLGFRGSLFLNARCKGMLLLSCCFVCCQKHLVDHCETWDSILKHTWAGSSPMCRSGDVTKHVCATEQVGEAGARLCAGLRVPKQYPIQVFALVPCQASCCGTPPYFRGFGDAFNKRCSACIADQQKSTFPNSYTVQAKVRTGRQTFKQLVHCWHPLWFGNLDRIL